MIILSSGQVGVSSLDRSRDLDCGCGGRHGFLSSWQPGFGVGLNANVGGRVRVGLGIKAVSKEESDGRLVGGGVLEKGFKFTPSFGKYVKAMESVISDRERKRERNLDGSELWDGGKGGELAPLGGEERRTRGDRGVVGERRIYRARGRDSFNENASGGDGWEDGYSEGGRERRRIGAENHGPNRKVSVATTRGRSEGVRREGKWSSGWTSGMNSEFKDWDSSDRSNAKYVSESVGSETSFRTSGREMRLSRRKVEAFSKESNGFEGGDVDRGSERATWGRSQVEAYRSPGKEVAQNSRSLHKQKLDAFAYGGDSEPKVERTAFRNYEDLKGVIGKPQVTKSEMEERIQKLARSINGADIDVPERIFSKMMHSARIKFSDRAVLRLIQILGRFGNWRRVLQVIEWLETRERFESNRLRYVYTTALGVLGKARRPVEALNIFHAMQKQMSSYPDLAAYHSIAVTLGQAGHMKELFDVIDTMSSPPEKKFKTGFLGNWDPRLEPDIIVYNSILSACVKRKQWEGAFWVLQQLKQRSMQPTNATYGLIMEVMFSCGKYNLVHGFFRKLQKSSVPNASAYKVLVNTFAKEGKIDDAVSAVQDMERRGIVGSAVLYYDLARCLCSAGRTQEAIAQVEKTSQVASKPLVVTYTSLLQACVDSGHIEDAVYIFNHMKQFCSPNLVTCNIMLKAYLDHQLFEEAKELFFEMAEDEEHIQAESDYHFHVLPDLYTFNTMLEAFVAEKRWEDFVYIYGRMLKHGYHFNAKRHLRMILDALRAGKNEPAELTWKYLAREGRIPPTPLIKQRFCSMLERGDHHAALACVRLDLKEELQNFSETAWLNLLEENSDRFSRDSLIRVLNEGQIISRSNSPNRALQNLLTSCREYLKTRSDTMLT